MKTDVMEQNIAELSFGLLKMLLIDKTTKKYIRWGSDNYNQYGAEYRPELEMMPNLITGDNTLIIQPRVTKDITQQVKRTRDKAEVFTPSWVCNEQNNLVDAGWFGRPDVFNKRRENTWETLAEPIRFPENKTWKNYVDARRLEVSCGEAPYLVSRYDTVTGMQIPIKERIGIIDRKLRVINENTSDEDEWFKWVIRAYQSVYGYDFQGDNVLLARENLLFTFVEYAEDRFGERPELKQIKKIANIIAWNIWQMNGLTMTAPYSVVEREYYQMSISEVFDLPEAKDKNDGAKLEEIPCRIYDWRKDRSMEFRSVNKGDRK